MLRDPSGIGGGADRQKRYRASFEGERGQVIRFDGQAAIVTGAGSGIGRATALELARRGARVLVNDPADALAAEVVDEIRSVGGSAVTERSAVGTIESAQAIARSTLEAFGRIDILINNAGISRPAAFGEDSDEDIDLVFAVNLRGPYALMRAVWPTMRNRHYGRILNTASSAALGSGISGAYAPTKAGIIGLTKEAALAGRNAGILVNAIMPSAHTALLQNHPDLSFRAWVESNLPARLVATTSVYLVSGDVSLSGEVLATRGGLVQRIAFHESEGLFDPKLEPESLRERIGGVLSAEGGTIVASQADHAAAINRLFPR